MDRFIARWAASNAGERSNFQLFMSEFCDVLGVPPPNPATENEADNEYVFERSVAFNHDDGSRTIGRIDLYKRGSFVLEGKQSKKREQDDRARAVLQLGLDLGAASFTRTGTGKREGRGWDAVMAAAKQQAESYAKALPKEDGWPPFIIVVDVGHVIEIYADFSLQGKHYAQFPDRQGYRISMDDLRRKDVQDRLRAIWTDPMSLDPSRRSAEVTREIAELLAKLSQSLERRGYNAASVAAFLMRCLFTMFAEDVGLLKPKSFQSFLEHHVGKADQLHLALPHLWQAMNSGGYSPTLGETILKFNGGLFSEASAIPLDEQDLNWLILAAKRVWTNVEPAIFGTLLERALNERERHKLGAHYTPRAYVERLVVPTIIEPLTEDWRAVQTEAADFLKKGEKERARAAVKAFHTKLCQTRVLDPACGTGNFLYVALELMKRLEGEVLQMLADLGEDQYLLELDRHTVDPHQFLGLEINPRAVAIAELVLWIGYLQWHFRTRGKVLPAEPVLKAFANIKEQDAVLQYDKQEILRDKTGHPLTRWDGIKKNYILLRVRRFLIQMRQSRCTNI
ncbi:MAG TPA: type IIL restriction-modification enzyme MmeI [Micropepsaceae bacterium]|nr:type IIL restriction-modification enzyme MmeI [Micropepsaceae bacterium]